MKKLESTSIRIWFPSYLDDRNNNKKKSNQDSGEEKSKRENYLRKSKKMSLLFPLIPLFICHLIRWGTPFEMGLQS